MARKNSNVSALVALLLGGSVLPAAAAEQDWVYPVKRGDTLIGITRTYVVKERSWQDLKQHNDVTDARRLPIGSTLKIPVSWLKPLGMLAKVVAVKGEVTRDSGGTSQPVTVDQLLLEGETIRTGADSSALIELNDGSRIFALANSTLKIARLAGQARGADVRLKLDEGRIENEVKRKNARSRFEVKTPTAQIGVRGTEFRVAVSDSATKSEVTEGKVQANSQRGSALVSAGFGTVIATNKVPQKPQALLAAPALPDLAQPLTRLPARIRWPDTAGATAYRVEALPVGPAQTYLVDQVQSATEARFADLEDGDYLIKVRAIDGQGLEGQDAARRFVIWARPEPPVVIAPTPERAVREDRPEFSWARSLAAESYKLQVARSESFADLAADAATVEGTTFRPPAGLQPGDYYWRIASRASSGKLGPFGEAQKFTYKLPPAAGKAEPPKIDDNRLRFRWSAGEAGQKHRFQFSRDAEFNNLLVDDTLAEPYTEVANPGGGTYYLRLQTIDSDGFAGPFSAPQQVEVPRSYWPFLLLILVPLLL